MFKRNIQIILYKAIARSSIVLLTGPCQVGKSTLVKLIAQEKGYSYVTFDDLVILAGAKSDPVGFIASLNKPVIIDEVQRCPEIFLPIKKDIDINREPGRYILISSANTLLIPQIGDSLVGRMEILDLFPLSQGELHSDFDTFIDKVFGHDTLKIYQTTDTKKDLYQKIVKGGYPAVQALDTQDSTAWFNGYITTILYRDVQELSQVTALLEFPKLLQFLALRAGNLLNVAELSRAVGIPSSTLRRYLELLQILFIVRLAQPWSSNRAKRMVRTPKIYLIDSGLLCYLSKINLEGMLENSIYSGAILENFVFQELLKQSTWSKYRVELFHYRTASGIEVDIILENEIGNIVGVEIKLSQTVSAYDFKGLKYLQEELGNKFIKGILLYAGSHIVPFGQNLFAVPISALWNDFSK